MRHVGLLLALTANLIGGLTYPVQKAAMEGLPPATVTCGRNLVALIVMYLWMVRRGPVRWRYPRADMVRLVILGVFAYGTPLMLGIVGTQLSSAGNASILILLEPGAILVLSWLLLKESIGATQLLGVGLGLVGGLVLALDTGSLDALTADRFLLGNALLLLHGLFWGLYTPLMHPLAARHHPLDVTFMVMLMGQVVLTPMALLEAPGWSAGPALPAALGWTLLLGVVGSFVGTVCWTWALRHIRASVMAPFLFVQPLAGAGVGVLVMGEVLTAGALWGGALIAGGVLCVLRSPRTETAVA